MKRVAWLLSVRARAVSEDQAQKRKMREDGDMYQGRLADSCAQQQTRDLRNEDRQTDKSCAMVAAKDSRSDPKKDMDDDHMRPLVAKTHGKNDRPFITDGTALDHPKSLLDDAPAVGQSTCTKWTGLDSRATAVCWSR
jgi:hypothetical protein